MEYDYDRDKSRRNFEERGIDFEFASRIFDADFIEWEDRRVKCGERGMVAVGPIDKSMFVVVYTRRDGRRRIISARRANRRERSAYHKAIGSGGDSEGTHRLGTNARRHR